MPNTGPQPSSSLDSCPLSEPLLPSSPEPPICTTALSLRTILSVALFGGSASPYLATSWVVFFHLRSWTNTSWPSLLLSSFFLSCPVSFIILKKKPTSKTNRSSKNPSTNILKKFAVDEQYRFCLPTSQLVS